MVSESLRLSPNTSSVVGSASAESGSREDDNKTLLLQDALKLVLNLNGDHP